MKEKTTPRDKLPSVVRRMTAGKMLARGASVAKVAEKMQMGVATVRRYREIIDEGGLDALRAMSIGGRPSALDEPALKWIEKALLGSAQIHGFPTDAWTNGRVRELVASRYGVTYSRVYTWQIVTNMGLGHRLSKSTR